jgi:Ca-activated chloride channel homolog
MATARHDCTSSPSVGPRPPRAQLAEAIHRVRAQAEIAGLMSAAKVDVEAVTQLGKRWGVVTPYTSLLVLDRIEDYVRYRVEPKEAELAAEYRRHVAALPKVEAEPGLQARLDALLLRWQAFRDYHAAPYPGIETLLVPMAEQEVSAWGAHQGGGEARVLLERARSLAARWTREAGDASRRDAWEREAARLVFALEALREQRGKAPLIGKDAGGDAAEVGVSSLADRARDEAAEHDDRERLEVMATRQAATRPAMLPPPAPAPEPAAPALGSNAAGAAREDQAKAESANSPLLAATTPPARIQLSGWTPDAPYLESLRASPDPYAAYLAIRDEHAATPSFFLDVADLMREQAKDPALALRVLSNLAEIDHGNTALVRVLAYRLSQWERHTLAVPQFEEALAQRPEEPQSWRDLALALARQPAPDRRRAVELLWAVATRDWHGRFPDIELIALHELNDVLAQAQANEITLRETGVDPRFLDPVAVGLRVVLTWDADNTDIDLWVVDPSGDKAVYSQPRTRTGGHMSRDFTQGYGPEVYTIRRPLPGTYIVLVNYFGDRRQSLTGPVTLQLEFQTRFGSAGGERVAVTRRLGEGGETIEIGRFEVGRE